MIKQVESAVWSILDLGGPHFWTNPTGIPHPPQWLKKCSAMVSDRSLTIRQVWGMKFTCCGVGKKHNLLEYFWVRMSSLGLSFVCMSSLYGFQGWVCLGAMILSEQTHAAAISLRGRGSHKRFYICKFEIVQTSHSGFLRTCLHEIT